MTREEDVERKIKLIREYMKQRGASGTLIRKTYNFSWITGGGRSYILPSDSEGMAYVFITMNDSYIIANNNEVNRLKNEELTENFSLVSSPWFMSLEDMVLKVADDQKILYEEDADFNSFLFHSRTVLSTYEIEKYAEVGRQTATALERAMRMLNPKMTEIEVKALIMHELTIEGVEPLLVLVFGNNSRKLYKHNLPRNIEISDVCIASVCARLHGLIASATRSVEFTANTEFERMYATNAEIDAEIIHSSYEHSLISQVFFDIENIYEKHGFPLEWQRHHQGGIAGYKTREVLARPHLPFQLKKNMAFAWNPTLEGTKSEDTYLRTSDEMRLLTRGTSEWPYLEFEINGTKYRRPALLKF